MPATTAAATGEATASPSCPGSGPISPDRPPVVGPLDLGDERAQTCARFWRRAHHWFALHGISVARVLTDNGAGYRSRLFGVALSNTSVRQQRTRPYRPQTNGKVERFNRTLLEEWAHRRLYRSNAARERALQPWVHRYNHHRAHTSLGGRPPISRVNNLPGYYN